MANRYVFQMLLLLCFSTTALSMSYRRLQIQQRSGILACRNLLFQLNEIFQYCIEDGMDFKVPEEIKRPQNLQKEKALLIIHEVLQQIAGIFKRNVSATGWNATVLRSFHVELHWQMDRLETVLEKLKEKKSLTWGKNQTLLRLKLYYLRIVQYLKAKMYSKCAWTIVQAEILKNFSFLYGLTDFLQPLPSSAPVPLGRSHTDQDSRHSSTSHSSTDS